MSAPIRPLPSRAPFRLRLLTAATLFAAMAGCGGDGGGDSHDHGQTHIDTAGRLAIIEHQAPAVHIHDLDTHQREARHTLANPATAVHASPGKRYAIVVQRPSDRVQFVDGGIWQEDHGNHMHDYRRASKLLSWQLDDPAPTHYNPMENGHATIFMDGKAATTPQRNASVVLFNEQSISNGRALARLSLGGPMHGLAQQVDDTLLLTTLRSTPATADSVLPDRIQVWQRANQDYTLQRTLTGVCEGMHGGASTGTHTAVGCMDGILLLSREGQNFTERKIALPHRISSLQSHPKWPGHFIGTGNAGTPATTHVHALDAATGTATEVSLPGWPAGTVRRALTVDRQGRVLILDSTGALHTLARGASGWQSIRHTPSVVPTMPTQAPWPALAASNRSDTVFLTDPATRQLLTIDPATHQITRRDTLDFVPASLTWLGIGS